MRLVVQLGFGGSRRLLDVKEHPEVDEGEFLAKVQEHLGGVLRELPTKLGLTREHFLCGVSQLAVGADTLFTRACKDMGIGQRIFLPQHRDPYFEAVDKDGVRDFTEAEAKVARDLLKSDHIIEDRLVSHSPDRTEQFEDVNLELVRVSDVLIALQRANAVNKRGGTGDLIRRAQARHRPLLEITVSVQDGRPFFREQWHPNKPYGEPQTAPLFKPPRIPAVLQGCLIPEGEDFATALKHFSSARSKRHQGVFKWAALTIIGMHFLATLCAVTGLAFKRQVEAWEWGLLAGELAFLAIGFTRHRRLHHSRSARHWATARLVSEITRSVTSMAQVPGYLGHLFLLPLPGSLRPLMRTLNYFHLKATRRLDPATWSGRRDAYVRHRLMDAKAGQIPYYREQHGKACCWLNVANIAFSCGSIFAFAAVATKLILIQQGLHPEELMRWAGFLAIILPVISVAALSLAASFDLEARRRTYEEMIHALEEVKGFIGCANSEREFAELVLQTEARLVGEYGNWFSRRAFTGVA